MNLLDFLSYLICFLFGLLTGTSELLSRYRKLSLIFKTAPGLWYIFINGFVSALAYFILIRSPLENDKHYINILVAGFSSLAILRSSFFIYKNKETGQSTPIGLSIVIQVFLDWADRTFDQEQSTNELSEVAKIMSNVDYRKANTEMVSLAINFMDNLSDVEKQKLSEYVKELDNLPIPNQTKSLNLGKAISKLTGISLLAKIKENLGSRVLENQETSSEILTQSSGNGNENIQQIIKNVKEK